MTAASASDAEVAAVRGVFEHLLATAQTDDDALTVEVEAFGLRLLVCDMTPVGLALLAAVGVSAYQAAAEEDRSRKAAADD